MSRSKKIIFTLQLLILALVMFELEMPVKKFLFLSMQEHRNLQQKGSYRILCLGDSATAFGGEGSYPRQLEQILKQKDLGMEFSVINKGVAAITSDMVLANLQNNLKKFMPDMVIVMIGENDMRQARGSQAKPVSKLVSFLSTSRTYQLTMRFFSNRKRVKASGEFKEGGRNNIFDMVGLTRQTVEPISQIERPKEGNVIISVIDDYIEEIVQCPRYARERDPDKKIQEDMQLLKLSKEDAYLASGLYYFNCLGEHDKAEKMFKRVIEMNLERYNAHFRLGILYVSSGKLKSAEEAYETAIKIDPKHPAAYVRLGRLYGNYKMYHEADRSLKTSEDMFQKAIQISPDNYKLYMGLGAYYSHHNDHKKTEEMFKKAIEINPKEDDAYIRLGGQYMSVKDYVNAEIMINKAIEIQPYSDDARHLRKIFQLHKGQTGFVKAYDQKNVQRNKENLSANYRKIEEILLKRKIQPVFVQYPMRDLKQLQGMFVDSDRVIFVDNEKVFKDAVAKDGYEDYFYDYAAVTRNSGHGTDKGNRLLAENIANTILKSITPH